MKKRKEVEKHRKQVDNSRYVAMQFATCGARQWWNDVDMMTTPSFQCTAHSSVFQRHRPSNIANVPLHWRHNERDGVSNHQPHDSLLNRLFRRRSQKTSKLRVIGLCAGNSPVTDEFPTQRAINAENVSSGWRRHMQISSLPAIPCRARQPRATGYGSNWGWGTWVWSWRPWQHQWTQPRFPATHSDWGPAPVYRR